MASYHSQAGLAEAPSIRSHSSSDIKRSVSSTFSPRVRTRTQRIDFPTRPAVGHGAVNVRPAVKTEGLILQQATKTRSNLDSTPEGAATLPKRPAFKLPKGTEYARDRMARILVIIARGGGRVDFRSWEALAEQLTSAGLIEKAHPANLRFWVDELKACKILTQGSPGWIAWPLGETEPASKRPYSRPASGLRLTALCDTAELIEAGFSELETLLEGGRA